MVNSAPSSTEAPQGEFVIVGVGARTSIGLNALQTAMGIRAEVLRPSETRFVDPKGELIGMCCVNCINPMLTGVARLIQLARPAILEATADWVRVEQAKRGAVRPVPVVIALPASASDQASLANVKRANPVDTAARLARLVPAKRFLDVLDSTIPNLIDLQTSQEVYGGRAAGIEALARAYEMLNQGVDAVVVGGVDSHYDPDRLEAFANELRLHGLDTENGFIPGEAAAFYLLTQRRRASSYVRYASILGCSLEHEPRPWGSDEPCHALGMTAALRKAAQVVGPRRQIGWQLTDVVDERHRVDEWQIAAGRTFELYRHEVLHEQPLLTVGDVGAAAAALFTVEAAVRWHTGCAVADLAMLALHSDGSERGAALVAGEAR